MSMSMSDYGEGFDEPDQAFVKISTDWPVACALYRFDGTSSCERLVENGMS